MSARSPASFCSYVGLPNAGSAASVASRRSTARWTSGEPDLNDELDDYRWLAPDALGDLQVTPGLPEIIQSARVLIGV